MATHRNPSPWTIPRNQNRRRFPRDYLVELSVARLELSEFMDSKKNELRRLINDPSKVSFARSIQEAHAKLKKEVTDNRFLYTTRIQNTVMDMIFQFKKTVNFFLKSDSQVMIDDSFNYNLLDTAIATGCKNIVQDFLHYGFNINCMYDAPMERCCVPLHRAVQNKQKCIVELLIQYGADVNIMNHHDKTALFYAAQAGDLESVHLLLNNRALINDPDILTAGVLSRSPNIIRALLEHGADVNQKDLCGRTPLHFVSGNKKCSRNRLRLKYDDGIRAELARVLLQFGADADAKTTSGITSLHAAALKGYSQVAEILLINGATVDMLDSNNKTALLYALYNGYSDVVKVLLQYGADINILDDQGRSVLSMAHTLGRSKYAMVCNEFEPNVNIILKPTYLFHDNEYESDSSDYNFYDPRFYHDSRAKTINTIEQHIVKMITAGMFVRDEIRCQINMDAMASLREMCEEELEYMSRELLVNHLTGYHLITMDLDMLASYTKNSDIRDILQRYNYPEQFPLYGIIIEARIHAAIKREVTSKIETPLYPPGPPPPLPYIYAAPIISYWNDNNNIYYLLGPFGQLSIW